MSGMNIRDLISIFLRRTSSLFANKHNRPLLLFIWTAVVMIVFAWVSKMFSWNDSNSQYQVDPNWFKNFSNQIPFFAGIVIGLLSCLLLILIAEDSFLISIGIAKEIITEKKFAAFLMIFIAVIVAVISSSLKHPLRSIVNIDGKVVKTLSDNEVFIRFLTDDPGGLFTITVGTLTVFGLWLNLESLWEIKKSITSFSQLIDRVISIAKTATEKDKLHVLAYTPALGYLSEMESNWRDLYNSLITLDKSRIDITCLNETDLRKWHNLFVGRQTYRGLITQKDADNATENAKNVWRKIGTENVHEVPLDLMPGFYLFFTSRTAIIVTPLFLPFPDNIDSSIQQALPMVQMIGMETQDRLIISQVRQFYNLHLKASNNLLPSRRTRIGRKKRHRPNPPTSNATSP
jgi:hypothetical protein